MIDEITKLTLLPDEYLFIRCRDIQEVPGLAKAVEKAMPENHNRVIIHVGSLDFLKVEVT